MSNQTEHRAEDRQNLTHGNGFLTDVWVNLKRWLRKSTRTLFVIAGSVLQPILFLIVIAAVFGPVTEGLIAEQVGADVSYITYITPAIVILSVMETATSSGIGLIDDIESGMFDKILVSPMNRGAMLLGKALSEVVRAIVQTTMILIVGFGLLVVSTGGSVSRYIETGLPGLLGIFLIVVLFGLWSTAVANIVALVTRDRESTIIGVNLFRFPLLFLSSAFIPVAVVSESVQLIALFNPVTYGVDGIRALMLGEHTLSVFEVTAFSGIWNTLVPVIGLLLVLDILFGSIATYFLNRASNAEVS